MKLTALTTLAGPPIGLANSASGPKPQRHVLRDICPHHIRRAAIHNVTYYVTFVSTHILASEDVPRVRCHVLCDVLRFSHIKEAAPSPNAMPRQT